MTDVKLKSMDILNLSNSFNTLSMDIDMPIFNALDVSGDDNSTGDSGDKSGNKDSNTANSNSKENNNSNPDTTTSTDSNISNTSNESQFSTDGLESVALEGEKNDYFLSKSGEVVDKDGKVKYSKEEYSKLSNRGNVDDIPETYSIVDSDQFDETVYLNENNEIVNAKGDVLKTAEQVASEFEIEDESDPFIKGVKETNLFEDVDNIDTSKEGVTTVINTAYDKGIKKGKELGIDELKSKYPQLDDVLKHMELHGTDFSKYDQFPDYANMELSDNSSIGVLDAIVADWHRERGIKPDGAYINWLKNGDGYLDYVKGLKSELADIVVAKKQQRDQLIEAKNKEAADKANQYWGVAIDDKGNLMDLDISDSVYSKVIKTGELKIEDSNVELPKVIRSNITGQPKEYSRNEFFNWLYIPRPVELDGKRVNATGYEVEIYKRNQSRTINHDILDAFNVFTNGDNSQLIKQSVSKHKKANKTIKLNSKGSTSKNTNRKQVNVKPKMTID